MHVWAMVLAAAWTAGPALPGTKPLEATGDLASDLVAGVDQFCERQLALAVDQRSGWMPDDSSRDAFGRAQTEKRNRLRRMLGMEAIVEPPAFPSQPQSLLTLGERIDLVSWPVLRGVHGYGIRFQPAEVSRAGVIILPPTDPMVDRGAREHLEKILWLGSDLSNAGATVVVLLLVDHGTQHSRTLAGTLDTGLTHREFCYRPGFVVGRHLLGYETQKVLSAVDLIQKSSKNSPDQTFRLPICVLGLGEGGLVAILAGAISEEVSVCQLVGVDPWVLPVSYQPIWRNVFGMHAEFGLAELATLISPRHLITSHAGFASTPAIPTGRRDAPVPPFKVEPETQESLLAHIDAVRRQELAKNPLARAHDLWAKRVAGLAEPDRGRWDVTSDVGTPVTPNELGRLLEALDLDAEAARFEGVRGEMVDKLRLDDVMKRQIEEIIADTQLLLEESPDTRDEFLKKTRPAREGHSVEDFEAAAKEYREVFRRELMGHFDLPKLPAKPRSRRVFEESAYTGYEVVLDVFPDVIAMGILVVPKGIESNERRPTVVVQHGLEGRPRDVADPSVDNPAYNQYGLRLAERGFIVFAPQNLYIFTDRFRVLQRKLNPMGKTLFSVIVPQHEVIVDWLASLPMVDPARIGFYGLSYGGKSAMRIPALVERYALSICSADFNDWVWKNASTRSRYSYVNTAEYEIFEWNLGSTFNYAEMAALICPRPFMVERGHRDGVAPDDRVAFEYAKIRLMYADLGIPDRTTIEFFEGPHTIHGVETFKFLHRHLDWPSLVEPTPLNK
jgi:hypothetical protein